MASGEPRKARMEKGPDSSKETELDDKNYLKERDTCCVDIDEKTTEVTVNREPGSFEKENSDLDSTASEIPTCSEQNRHQEKPRGKDDPYLKSTSCEIDKNEKETGSIGDVFKRKQDSDNSNHGKQTKNEMELKQEQQRHEESKGNTIGKQKRCFEGGKKQYDNTNVFGQFVSKDDQSIGIQDDAESKKPDSADLEENHALSGLTSKMASDIPTDTFMDTEATKPEGNKVTITEQVMISEHQFENELDTGRVTIKDEGKGTSSLTGSFNSYVFVDAEQDSLKDKSLLNPDTKNANPIDPAGTKNIPSSGRTRLKEHKDAGDDGKDNRSSESTQNSGLIEDPQQMTTRTKDDGTFGFVHKSFELAQNEEKLKTGIEGKHDSGDALAELLQDLSITEHQHSDKGLEDKKNSVSRNPMFENQKSYDNKISVALKGNERSSRPVNIIQSCTFEDSLKTDNLGKMQRGTLSACRFKDSTRQEHSNTINKECNRNTESAHQDGKQMSVCDKESIDNGTVEPKDVKMAEIASAESMLQHFKSLSSSEKEKFLSAVHESASSNIRHFNTENIRQKGDENAVLSDKDQKMFESGQQLSDDTDVSSTDRQQHKSSYNTDTQQFQPSDYTGMAGTDKQHHPSDHIGTSGTDRQQHKLSDNTDTQQFQPTYYTGVAGTDKQHQPSNDIGTSDTDGQLQQSADTGIRDTDGRLQQSDDAGIRDTDGRLQQSDDTGIPDTDGRLQQSDDTGTRDTDGRLQQSDDTGIPDTDGRLQQSADTGIRDTDGRHQPSNDIGTSDTDGQLQQSADTGIRDTDGRLQQSDDTGTRDTDGRHQPSNDIGTSDTDGQLQQSADTGIRDTDGRLQQSDDAGIRDTDGRLQQSDDTGIRDTDQQQRASSNDKHINDKDEKQFQPFDDTDISDTDKQQFQPSDDTNISDTDKRQFQPSIYSTERKQPQHSNDTNIAGRDKQHLQPSDDAGISYADRQQYKSSDASRQQQNQQQQQQYQQEGEQFQQSQLPEETERHGYNTRSKSYRESMDSQLNEISRGIVNNPKNRQVEGKKDGNLSITIPNFGKENQGQHKSPTKSSFVSSLVANFPESKKTDIDKKQDRVKVHQSMRRQLPATPQHSSVSAEQFRDDNYEEQASKTVDDSSPSAKPKGSEKQSMEFPITIHHKQLLLNNLEKEIWNHFRIAHRVKTSFPNLEIILEDSDLKFSGPRDQVENAIEQARSKTSDIIQHGRQVNLSRHCLQFLKFDEPWKFVKSQFDIACEYYVKFTDADLVVYSDNQRDIDRICKIIKEAAEVKNLDLITIMEWKSDTFASFTNEIGKKYGKKVIFFMEEDKKFVIATKDIIQNIMSEINKICQIMRKPYSQIVEFSQIQYTFLKRWPTLVIPKVMTEFQVKIEEVFGDDSSGWKVEGPQDNVALAVNEIMDRIVTKDMVVKDSVCQMYFQQESEGKDFLSSTEEMFKCCIGTKQYAGSDALGGSTYDNTKTWTYSNGATVGVMCGNCNDCFTDLVIIPKPQKSSEAVVPLEDLSQKKLQGNYVEFEIPVWRDGKRKEKQILGLHIDILFEKLKSEEVTSISISFEVEKSTGWGDIKFLKQILEKFKAETRLKCILFHSSRARCADAEREIEIYLAKDIGEGNIGSSSSSFNTDQDKKDFSRICIKVSKGILVDKDAEVLVNTTSKDLLLHNGAVSKSILDKAGSEIQNECTKHYPYGVKYGEVAVTKGHLLKAGKVYHGAVPGFDNLNKDTDLLESFVIKCLLQANKDGLSEICFPSIGTGNLGYPKDVAAQAMFEAVERFESSGRNHTVTNVNFVIFPKDQGAVQAFQVAEGKHYNKSVQTDIDEVVMKLENDKTMIVSFGKPFDYDADGMVVFWTKDFLYAKQKSYLKSAGGTSMNIWDKKDANPKTYLKDAGSTYMNAWEKRGRSLSSCKYLCMDAGYLPFGSIFHQFVDEKSSKLGIQQLFVNVEKEGLKDVVVPLVSTDPIIELMESVLPSVYQAFKLDKVKKLKTVRIIVDDIKHLHEAKKQFSQFQTVSDRKETNTHQELLLTVTSNEKSNVEDAIKKLELKIEDIKKHHTVTDKPPRPPPPVIKRKKEDSATQIKVADDMKGDLKGHQSASFNETDSIQLEKTDEEKCRVVFKVLDNKLLAKNPNDLKLWLIAELSTLKILQASMVFPYHADHQGLIIFHTQKEASDFLEKNLLKGKFEFSPFPAQVLTNVHAELAGDLTQILAKIDFKDLKKEIEGVSGARLEKNNSTYYLEGSLNDISIAESYINDKLIHSDQPMYEDVESSSDEFQNDLTKKDSSSKASQFVKSSQKTSREEYEMREINKMALSPPSVQTNDAAEDQSEHKLQSFDRSNGDGNGDVNKTNVGLELSVGKHASTHTNQRQLEHRIEEFGDNVINKGVGAENVNSPIHLKELMKTNEGISVYVYTGDLLNLNVECIVNATSAKLEHAGGLSLKIAKIAGKELLEDCQRHVETEGNLPVGGACVTRAGNLKQYKYVIHIVGPDWKKYHERDPHRKNQQVFDDLCNAVISSLFKAHKLKCQSIALPAVSSGVNGVPMDICISAYVNSVRKFSQVEGTTSTLKEIHFVDLLEPTVQKIASGFMNPQISHTKEIPIQYPQQADNVQTNHSQQPHNDKKSTNLYPYMITSNQTIVQIHVNEKLQVIAHTGDILKEKKAHAIVSPEDECFLGKSKIAKLLLEKGGAKYMDEHKNLKANKSKYKLTDVVVTEAGNLPFHYVLHAIMPIWEEKEKSDELKKAYLRTYSVGVENILEQAFKLPISAIAFPLFGAGKGLSSIDLGNILIHSIIKISKKFVNQPGVQLEHIYIVNRLKNSTEAIFKSFQSFIDKTFRNEELATPLSSSTAQSQEIQMFDNTSLYGKQPNGSFKSYPGESIKLPGFENFSTIVVDFTFPAGRHTAKQKCYDSLKVSAYLPDSSDGKIVLELLHVAFEQKKLFRVAYNTDQVDVIKFKKDIHLKTNVTGGKTNYGYPDKNYLSDVKKQLKRVGITEDCLKSCYSKGPFETPV